MIGQISAQTSFKAAPNQFRTSSISASVMEFGFKHSRTLSCSFYRPDALSHAHPTVSKHWRHSQNPEIQHL